MNQQNQQVHASGAEENVLFGVIGAFLFSLVGAVLYYVLYLAGFISGISALVAVVCSIKGYAFFAKKESKRGIVISVIIAAVVIILAWYLCFCSELALAYEEWYAEGTADWTPNMFQCIPFAFYYLVDVPVYFLDLLWSAVFGGIACFSSCPTSPSVKRPWPPPSWPPPRLRPLRPPKQRPQPSLPMRPTPTPWRRLPPRRPLLLTIRRASDPIHTENRTPTGCGSLYVVRNHSSA